MVGCGLPTAKVVCPGPSRPWPAAHRGYAACVGGDGRPGPTLAGHGRIWPGHDNGWLWLAGAGAGLGYPRPAGMWQCYGPGRLLLVRAGQTATRDGSDCFAMAHLLAVAGHAAAMVWLWPGMAGWVMA